MGRGRFDEPRLFFIKKQRFGDFSAICRSKLAAFSGLAGGQL